MTELDYAEVAALADRDLADAETGLGHAEAQAAAVQLRIDAAVARVREAAAIREFIARHSGLTLTELLAAAGAEVAEAQAAADAAQAEVARAEAAAAQVRETLRDHEGHLRILKRQRGDVD